MGDVLSPRSTLARIQQFTTIALLGSAVAWLVWHAGRSPWIGVGGFVLILFSHSAVLAAEFVAAWIVNRADPVPRARPGQLARAWLGETLQDLLVFCWRQPFRWNAVPDRLEPASVLQGQRGIVFVPGFVCNRGFWTPWLRTLRAQDRAFVAVNLEPVFGSIDGYVPLIEKAVAAVTEASGLAPVLVCHSMGGLAARAWLRCGPHAARVHHVVTIASPHRGTLLARFSRMPNGRQMACGSDWLRPLEADAADGRPPFTCWYSNCDNVVFPASSATLAGADNRLLPGVAHVELAFQPEVIAATLALLRRSDGGE